MTRTAALLGGTLAILLAACSGGVDSPPPDADAGQLDAPPVADAPPMTWSQLYAAYFGPSTPGHCSESSSCHLMSQGGFMCGTTPDSCYKGMVAAALVDPAHPTMSALADPNLSPLAWFGGNMPRDMPGANAEAARDVAAWVAAGAQEN
jgi:hypothetical protein